MYKNRDIVYRYCPTCGKKTKHLVSICIYGGDYNQIEWYVNCIETHGKLHLGEPMGIVYSAPLSEYNSDLQRELKEAIGGSECFITTATLASLKTIDDNCYELTIFRKFRDTWLKEHHPEDIDEYYRIAPRIVTGINASKESEMIYKNIWSNYLYPCLTLIENGKNSEAYELYKQTVLELMSYAN